MREISMQSGYFICYFIGEKHEELFIQNIFTFLHKEKKLASSIYFRTFQKIEYDAKMHKMVS